MHSYQFMVKIFLQQFNNMSEVNWLVRESANYFPSFSVPNYSFDYDDYYDYYETRKNKIVPVVV